MLTSRARASVEQWPLGKRTYIMGILNLTPDSFSDGGHQLDTDVAAAVREAAAMVRHEDHTRGPA